MSGNICGRQSRLQAGWLIGTVLLAIGLAGCVRTEANPTNPIEQIQDVESENVTPDQTWLTASDDANCSAIYSQAQLIPTEPVNETDFLPRRVRSGLFPEQAVILTQAVPSPKMNGDSLIVLGTSSRARSYKPTLQKFVALSLPNEERYPQSLAILTSSEFWAAHSDRITARVIEDFENNFNLSGPAFSPEDDFSAAYFQFAQYQGKHLILIAAEVAPPAAYSKAGPPTPNFIGTFTTSWTDINLICKI